MKVSNWFKLTVAALLISGTFSSNAMAASTTGTAEASVIVPITIEAQDVLSFGGIVSGTPGTVTVDLTDGTLSSSGVQTITPTTHGRASFNITLDPNVTFNITIDPSVTLSNGTDSMSADLLGFLPLSLVPGNETLLIGGTLTVVGTESPGAYTGTFNVTADYL